MRRRQFVGGGGLVRGLGGLPWLCLVREFVIVSDILGGGHTTASCSFSSCMCRSAAVRGRGWRRGPRRRRCKLFVLVLRLLRRGWMDGTYLVRSQERNCLKLERLESMCC